MFLHAHLFYRCNCFQVGWRPIHYAAASGKVANVMTLSMFGADKEARGQRGARPLHAAAASGRVEAVSLLLSLARPAPSTRAAQPHRAPRPLRPLSPPRCGPTGRGHRGCG